MTAAAPKARWYRITPGRLMFLLLIIEGLLWISQRFKWFAFNRHKGFTVLIAVASFGLAMIVIFLWLLRALVIRQRFQFSIRSLFLLIVVVAIPCGWLAMESEAARKQRKVVVELKKAGGTISYDYQLPPGVAIFPRPTPPGPPWLRNLLGDDLFVNVTRADLTGSEVSDAELHDLEGLAQLQSLDLDRTNVNDAGIQHLTGLNQLRYLYLDGTKVSDVGLQHLKGLTQLRTLGLGDTDINDFGLQYLKGLNKLQSLNLSGTKVSDVGLEHLKGLQLRELFLGGTKVSDAGLQHLKGLKQLRYLHLDGTKVSDVGLEQLKGSTQLFGLFFKNTNVTDAGVEKLRQALPNCQIRHTQE